MHHVLFCFFGNTNKPFAVEASYSFVVASSFVVAVSSCQTSCLSALHWAVAWWVAEPSAVASWVVEPSAVASWAVEQLAVASWETSLAAEQRAAAFLKK